VLCIFTLFVTSILTILVASSLPPLGDTVPLALELAPLNNGFERMFSMSYRDASTLSIPATFATAFGFVYGYSRVILSMARSGLFPSCLSLTFGKYRTPYVAILVGSLLSYGLVLFAHFVPITQTYLYNICILSGFTAYVSQLSGFILFRIRHPDQERLYVSPLGIPGAVFGIVVFSFSAVSVMGFQNDNSVAFVTYLFLIFFASIYYFAYARKRQYFSVEERFIFSIQIIKCE
jgi:ethanolamine permease